MHVLFIAQIDFISTHLTYKKLKRTRYGEIVSILLMKIRTSYLLLPRDTNYTKSLYRNSHEYKVNGPPRNCVHIAHKRISLLVEKNRQCHVYVNNVNSFFSIHKCIGSCNV